MGVRMAEPKKLLSMSETAALLAVSQNTLRKWADAGRVPTVRRPGGGGLRRFDPDVIERTRREMGLSDEDASGQPS